MSYSKRGKWYWADFSVNGQRYRVPLGTTDWREAAHLEAEYKARAREGKLPSRRSGTLARLLFDEAMDRFLTERKIEILRPDHEAYLARPLRNFFGGNRLRQITAEDVRAYQAHRLGQGRNPNTVNHEIKLLFRLLKRARLLHLLRDEVKLLPRVKTPRQALTAEEKRRLFQTAASNPEWQTAYCAALLTANTTMRPCELKRLLWRDCDSFNRLVTVRRSKTEAGSRVIPLNEEAWSAVVAMEHRARSFGAYAPEHYIFHRQWPKIDPSRPMSGWRSAWRSLRKAAAKGDPERGLPEMPRLANLRYYDLRHQSITEMLEAGIPEGVIREVAGHVDPAMTRHYSHPRLAARKAAVEALSTVPPQPGGGESDGSYVTNCVTK